MNRKLIALLFASAFFTLLADDGIVEYEGARLKYEISGDHAVITGYESPLPKDLSIPESVTHDGTSYPVKGIGSNCFFEDFSWDIVEVTSVKLNRGLEFIDQEAFKNVGGDMPEIEFPSSLTNVASDAFRWTRLGCEDAFVYADTGHTYLVRINVHDDVGDELVIPDTVRILCREAFYQLSLRGGSVVLPDGLQVLGDMAFEGASVDEARMSLPGTARPSFPGATCGTEGFKVLSVTGAPPDWDLAGYFKGVEKIGYDEAFGPEWMDYAKRYPGPEYVETYGGYVPDPEKPFSWTVGRYFKLSLSALSIPVDTNKYTVKAEGLPKGLKLVTEPKKDAKNKVIAYRYCLEGVPTETLDFETQKAYVRVTKPDRSQALWPLHLKVVAETPQVLPEGCVNVPWEAYSIANLWPDAAVHPKEWSFTGWPTGLKYNNTAKPVTAKQRIDGVNVTVTNARPYEIYGTPTKAGDYTVKATHTHKVGTASVRETFTATMRVWADGEKTVWNDQAYVVVTKSLDEFGTVKSVTGLPTGLKFTAKDLTDRTYGAIAANTVYGKPTKAGTFVVTLMLPDPGDARKTVKTSYLWTIAPADAPTFELDMGEVGPDPRDAMTQIAQGATWSFAITTSDPAAKVTVTGLPTGLRLVQDKATKLYTVEGIATNPGDYFATFKTVLNGVTTVTTMAFTVKANPIAATYLGVVCAHPAADAEARYAVAEVTVAAAGTVKLTYTEGKTKYTASVKSFEWDGWGYQGTARGLVLKASSADKKLGYGDRVVTVDFRNYGFYLNVCDAGGKSLGEEAELFVSRKPPEGTIPASQTYVFRDASVNPPEPFATLSAAYDAKKGTAAFSGKLFDGTAIKATVPVIGDELSFPEEPRYWFAPFLVIAKDGTVYCFDSRWEDPDVAYWGCFHWVDEDGRTLCDFRAPPVEYPYGDRKFAELVPEAGTFTFGWGSDAETVGAATESFTFAVTTDKNNKPTGVAIYDADPQSAEKPLTKVTAKVGKTTGAISVSFTSKKGDKAKYAVELVWQGVDLFKGHVTRTWKDGKVSYTAYGTAEVK